jgi:MFS family permease
MHNTRPPQAPRVSAAANKKNFPWNVAGILLFEFTWGLGIPFGLFASMAPAYLSALGSSKSLIGLLNSLFIFLVPLQLLGSRLSAGRRRVRTWSALYMGGTGIRLVYDMLAVFAPHLWTPASSAGLFVLACTGYVGLYMTGQTIYTGIVTDNIPERRRGWLFGLRSLCLGVGGIGMGFLASMILHRWETPFNYRVSFLVCDSIWTLSTLFSLLLRDRPRAPAEPAATGYLQMLVQKFRILLSNPNYRIFIFFHGLNMLALAFCGFIVPYARERLGVSDQLIAWLSVLYLASGAAFGVILGRLADKVGYRSVGAVQSLLLLFYFAVVLSARSFLAIGVAYTLYSIVNISSAFVLVNMSVELCPSLSAADLTALGGLLMLPVVGAVSPLAGRIIDASDSFAAVFYMGAAIAAIALLGFALLVREPRTGRLLEIRQIEIR